jgi:hypothetical protein
MKRFTETTKWDDPWFRKLPPRLKCLWLFLCDRCDPAGVIDVDYELASFQIGEEMSEADVGGFKPRVEKLKCGKWWIVQFVGFQYGSLSEDCKAHGPVFTSLASYNLKDRVSKGYPKGIQSLKEKEKEKDKGVQGDEIAEKAFLEFWKIYPRRVAKEDARKAWKKINREQYDEIFDALETQATSEDWRKDGGKFIPYPASWINGRRWEDSGAECEIAKGVPGTAGNPYL